MQSKSYLFLLVVLALTGLSGFLYTQRDYSLGLDVQGGVRLTYEMDQQEIKDKNLTPQLDTIRSNLIKTLTNRAGSALGVVEATIQAKPPFQFIIELPGLKDIDRAREVLQSTASIKCYWAKNVVTDKVPGRPYQDEKGDETGKPQVNFVNRLAPTVLIKPGDPRYKEIIKGWELILEGSDLSDAGPTDHGGRTVPNFEFSGDGSRKLEAWSRKVLNLREKMAFVLDDKVLSIAPVQNGAILSHEAFIDGQFDPKYVQTLCSLLKAGALPVTLREMSSQTVDPTIGKTALHQMITAGMISFGVICLFLVVYYMFPGIVAVLSLGMYVLLTLTVLKLIGATFSLAAIAGFILSVGMAVDANILVFERVKEEMREGRKLMTSIELGFKRALPAIVDSNTCTIITSMVLAWFGTGPVKGFASTLVIGVAISLFTAVTVTRSLLVFLVGSGLGANEKLFGLGRQWFGEKYEEKAHHEPLKIVETSKKWFMLSLATIIPGLIFISIGGLKPNVEFMGGYEAVYALPATGSLDSATIQKNLEAKGYKGSNVKLGTTGDKRYAYVTVPANAELKRGTEDARTKLAEAAGFGTEKAQSFTEVGPSVQRETIINAILAIVISSGLIVLYLAFRFGIALGGIVNGIKFGASAIGALVHDVLVVLGVAAIVGYLEGWEVSALFITSMLTVIGFSVHDTIVIFDRIRENLRKPLPGEDFGHLCNRSITQSLARSINTSFTVVLTLLILIVFGTATPDLKFFCLAMLVGIVSGTYSSIYNASPILYLWDRAIMRKRGDEHSIIAEAAAESARLRAIQMQIASEAPRQVVNPKAAASQTGASANRGYGQVKRRSSAVDRSKTELDDE